MHGSLVGQRAMLIEKLFHFLRFGEQPELCERIPQSVDWLFHVLSR